MSGRLSLPLICIANCGRTCRRVACHRFVTILVTKTFSLGAAIAVDVDR
jgi:hypothetical protein